MIASSIYRLPLLLPQVSHVQRAGGDKSRTRSSWSLPWLEKVSVREGGSTDVLALVHLQSNWCRRAIYNPAPASYVYAGVQKASAPLHASPYPYCGTDHSFILNDIVVPPRSYLHLILPQAMHSQTHILSLGHHSQTPNQPNTGSDQDTSGTGTCL